MRFSLHPLAALAAFALLLPAPARAQDDDFAGVEEIIVTAERRAQTVQDLAQAVTALSADDLDRTNVEDIHALQHQVPSLHVTGGLPRPTIRGIGQDVVGPATDPGFILHINGTYVTQLATALLGFHDMERVEVLPGPTGIDYGRATTGGSMNFIWKQADPEASEFSGDAQLASHDAFRLRSVLNVPLADGKLASRWSGAYVFAPRPYHLSNPSDPDGLSQELSSNSLGAGGALRHSLHWTPNEDFRADFIVQWTRDGTPGGKARILDPFPAYQQGTFAAGPNVGAPCNWRAGAACASAQHPLFGGPPDYTDAVPNPDDPHTIYANRATSQHVETLWAQTILEWDLGDEFTLRSISNYQHYDYFVDHDWDGSTAEAERLQLDNRENGWAQELTLTSTLDGPLNFVVGVNGQVNEARTLLPIWDYQAAEDARNFLLLDAFNAGAYLAAAGGAPAPPPVAICGPAGGEPCLGAANPLQAGLPAERPYFNLDTDTETTLFGAFARADYEFTDTLSATLGVRYSYTNRRWTDRSYFDVFIEVGDIPALLPVAMGIIETANAQAMAAGAPVGPYSRDNVAWWTAVGPGSNGDSRGDISTANCEGGTHDAVAAAIGLPVSALGCPVGSRVDELTLEKSWNSTDGLARLEWRPREELLFYGYVSTGERHGGFNFYEAAPFDSEEIVAYELGAKTEWLDNTLVVNGAVFLYDYANKFVNVTLAGGASATTENIGDARVLGAEFHVQYEPTEALRAELTIGYLDTEILDSTTPPGGDPIQDDAVQPGFSGACAVTTMDDPATPAVVEGPSLGAHHGLGSCGRTLEVDLQGNALPRAPEWTIALGVEYAFQLASGATFTPRVDFSWRDEVNLWQYGNPLEVQESYTNTNLRFRYTPASEAWYLEAFVENVEDENEVKTNPESRTAHPQYWLAEPRLYGLRAGWSFSELPW